MSYIRAIDFILAWHKLSLNSDIDSPLFSEGDSYGFFIVSKTEKINLSRSEILFYYNNCTLIIGLFKNSIRGSYDFK